QSRSARLVHSMKSGGEAALAANEIRPALEDLRGQTGGHTSWLTGEGTSHIKPSGRIAAGYHLDRADGLRPRLLCSVQCIFGGGCARLDLRHVEVARKALLFAHVGEFRIILVDTECLLSVSFLLRGLDGGEVCTRYRSGERLSGKFVVGFQRGAFSLRVSFFRANAAPHVGLPGGASGEAIYPALGWLIRAGIETGATAVLCSRTSELRCIDAATNVAAKSLTLALTQTLHCHPWAGRLR